MPGFRRRKLTSRPYRFTVLAMPPTRLLYAEDDPDIRELIQFALETEGFEVVCPSTLKDFLRLVKDESWHL